MTLTEEQNNTVAKLYGLRAGVSQIAIEKDEVDKLQNDCAIAIKDIEERRKKRKNSLKSNREYLDIHNNNAKSYGAKFQSERGRAIFWGILTVLCLAVFVVLFGLEVKTCKGTFMPSAARKPLMFFAFPVAILIFGGFTCRSISSLKNHISEARSNNERFKQEIKNILTLESNIKKLTTNVPDYDGLIAKENEKFKSEADPHYVRAKAVYDGLIAEYGDFLDLDDWKNVDLLIFAYVSGRADTMQKAFEYVDGERRTERITNTMERATEKVATVFKQSIGELSSSLNSAFNSLSSSISSSMNQIAQSSQRQIEQLKQISASIDYNSALQAKQNVSMEKLSHNVKTFANDSIRARQIERNYYGSTGLV